MGGRTPRGDRQLRLPEYRSSRARGAALGGYPQGPVLVQRTTRGDDRHGDLLEKIPGSNGNCLVGHPGCPECQGRRGTADGSGGHGGCQPRRRHLRRDPPTRNPVVSGLRRRFVRRSGQRRRQPGRGAAAGPPTTTAPASDRSCRRCSAALPAPPISSPPCSLSPGSSAPSVSPTAIRPRSRA